MHAASRSALDACVHRLEELCSAADNPEASAARVGTELFDCVELLDHDRALRYALADAAAPTSVREHLVQELFAGKISELTVAIVAFAATQSWSTPTQLVSGLVELGRRALLTAATKSNVIDRVERELFQLSCILEREPELTSRLNDRSADPQRRRNLLAAVLYGKVSSFTEALALQAISRRERNPITDIAAISDLAAATRGRTIARVTTASPLDDTQRQQLSEKLARIYHSEIVIHAEVDPALMGGAIVRVGSEVIDGSTAGKLARLKANVGVPQGAR